MASMYKRNGVWYVKYFENGKRVRRSLKTRSIARARAKVVEIEASLETGRPVDHKRDSAVGEFTKAFLEHIQDDKRPHTVRSLSHAWHHFVEWAKPTRLSGVTPETIQAYKRHRLKLGYQNSTVRSTLLALSSVFSTAIKRLHVFEGPNPCKGVELPEPDEKFPRFLTLDEIDRLLWHTEAHSRDLYFLMALGIDSGMRKGELAAARWGWLDFTEAGHTKIPSAGGFKTKEVESPV